MNQAEFDRNLIWADGPAAVSADAVREALARDTFACIRGVIGEEEIRQSLRRIEAVFDPAKDHPPAGQPADAVRRNFQKLNVGGESRSANHDDARLFRAFYNPLWEDDVYLMKSAFERLARVRNQLAGLPLDFATAGIEDNGLWTASRFHQYPAGGGFFRRHTDYVVKDIADENATDFYQVVLTMTRKGEHFQSGGGFVDVGDERILIDDYASPGDIVVYDGRTVHGVEDIDPREPLNLAAMNGRLAGFATLFKKM